jgi:RNA polymerase sigma-70 factor (ECF subfamily)
MGDIDVLDRQHRRSVTEEAPSAVANDLARRNRELAFRSLAYRHLERSYRLATVVLDSASESQDAVHDAFLTAWRKFDTLRDPDRLDAWFDRIVVNTCRDRMRRSHRFQVRDISERPDIAGGDPTATVPDELMIRRALGRLSPDDRIVLALRYYRDMKVDDIAAAMDVRPRAAASRLHRALERLRRILERDEQEVAP